MLDKGFIRALDVDPPAWLEEEMLSYYLPSREPISYAALRARIYLVSADLIDHLHPPEKRCLPDSITDQARKALQQLSRETWEKLRNTPPEKLDSWSLIDETAERIKKAADQVFRDTATEECTVIETLAFYTLNPPQLKGVEPGPALFISTEKIEKIVDEELASIITATGSLRPWSPGYEIRRAKKELFRYALAHEVTHSYADLAPKHSPKRRYEGTIIARVIEESLATYYGLKSADDIIVKNWVLTKHPPEYRAAKTWIEHPPLPPYHALQEWTGFTPQPPIPPNSYFELRWFIRELHHLIHHLLGAPKALAPILALAGIPCIMRYAVHRNGDAYWKLLALYLLAQTPPRIP